ncbi:MAG: hypothetical protein DWH76_00260 [Planctomycetota bacterium]|nr:MAG: hypothetical protein DWH76_00260 [Planctomycetota bacterium]
MSTTTSTPKQPDTRGLAGQSAGETSVCAVTQTELLYRGYEIADLAANATFEEVSFLLLMGHKPSEVELKKFKSDVIVCARCPLLCVRPLPSSP